MPSADGFLDGMNDADVLGAWYSYGDWYNPAAGAGDCAVKGMYTADQCSSIAMPVPGEPFANTGGKMCTSGNAAKVLEMNYSAIWGTGIGFDTNNGGADVGGVKSPWDAVAAGINAPDRRPDARGVPVRRDRDGPDRHQRALLGRRDC